MPSSVWSTGPYSPAQEEVNALIRRLMDQPPTQERAEAYEQLLRRWADVCRPCQPHAFTTAA
ncbi:hypothetical protein [Streptomyces bluensis]|uniref:hypothetical protein n=1 Tax=Streptomyces bluensis TaxID=33897 RepID=UPI001064B17B|nr:hypothetical protein [Streptomyces bluensis]GGZ86037.1 hypothetical protein GCM10010344_61940 [Streptomyces bluensis]